MASIRVNCAIAILALSIGLEPRAFGDFATATVSPEFNLGAPGTDSGPYSAVVSRMYSGAESLNGTGVANYNIFGLASATASAGDRLGAQAAEQFQGLDLANGGGESGINSKATFQDGVALIGGAALPPQSLVLHFSIAGYINFGVTNGGGGAAGASMTVSITAGSGGFLGSIESTDTMHVPGYLLSAGWDPGTTVQSLGGSEQESRYILTGYFHVVVPYSVVGSYTALSGSVVAEAHGNGGRGVSGSSESNFMDPLSVTSLTFADGTTPESHGYQVSFRSGMTLPTAVPEPRSVVMLGTGILATLAALRARPPRKHPLNS